VVAVVANIVAILTNFESKPSSSESKQGNSESNNNESKSGRSSKPGLFTDLKDLAPQWFIMSAILFAHQLIIWLVAAPGCPQVNFREFMI